LTSRSAANIFSKAKPKMGTEKKRDFMRKREKTKEFILQIDFLREND